MAHGNWIYKCTTKFRVQKLRVFKNGCQTARCVKKKNAYPVQNLLFCMTEIVARDHAIFPFTQPYSILFT